MHSSQFVLAFVPVFLNSINTLEDLNATKEDIDRFVYKCAPRHLVSFGGALNRQAKLKDGYVEKAVKNSYMLDLKQKFPSCSLYIDSGGYQCGQGYIPKHEIPKFANFYKEFLVSYVDYYSWAFSLDIPPNDKIFTSWNDVYDINRLTYSIIDELPNDVKNSIIFVFHFRSPKIWDLWSKIALEYADLYGLYWSVGGVAGFNVNNTMPCWLYTLPLTLFLRRFHRTNERLWFHILGDFSWTTILFSQLVSQFIKRRYAKDIFITYDATSIVTGNLKYRYLWELKLNGLVDKVLIRKDTKHKKRNQSTETNLDAAIRLLTEFAKENNFPVLNITDIDRENSDSFLSNVSSYVVLQTIYQYWKIEKYCSDISRQLLDLYIDGHIDEFNDEVTEVLRKLHNGKLSRTVFRRRAYASTTLDILASLNVQRCEHILQMMSDEFMFVDDLPRWD